MAMDTCQHVTPLVGGGMPDPHLQRDVETVAKCPHPGDEDDNLVITNEHGVNGERTGNLVLRSPPATPDRLTMTPFPVAFPAASHGPHTARMPQAPTEVSVCRRPPRRPTPAGTTHDVSSQSAENWGYRP